MRTFKALGASTSMALWTELMGVSFAVVMGALLAVVLAISLSPLSPLGPVRFVYPYRGVSFDWTVLGFGLVVLVVVLEVIALVLARRELRRFGGDSEWCPRGGLLGHSRDDDTPGFRFRSPPDCDSR